MNRSTLDKLISSTGLVVAVALFAASAGLFYAYTFVHTQVRNQLAEQRIMFPEAGSASITAVPEKDQAAIGKYAGQQLLTGAQAEAFADHYINAHLQKVAGGKTYGEVSDEFLKMKPTDPTYAKVSGQRQTLFMGETLRGMLLNAYAFDTMGSVAKVAAFGADLTGLLLVVLAALGFYHSNRVKAAGTSRGRR